MIDKFEEYFETIANKINIKFEAVDSDEDEIFPQIFPKNQKGPFLFLHYYEVDGTENADIDAEPGLGIFSILLYVKKDDKEDRKAKLVEAEKIFYKIKKEMYANYQTDIFYFEVNTLSRKKTGPAFDNMYGFRCQFKFFINNTPLIPFSQLPIEEEDE